MSAVGASAAMRPRARRIFRRSSVKQTLQAGASIAGAIALWQVAVELGWLDRAFFPSPTTIAATWWDLVADGQIPTNLWISMQRVLLAFGFGAGAGVVLGLLLGYFPLFYRLVDPLIGATYPVPKLAILPLLLVLLGLGSAPIVAMAAILCFYPVVISTIAGVRGVDPVLVAVMRNFGGRNHQIFAKIILPGALPVIFAGLRLGAGMALEGEIAAEFVAATDGLGAKTWTYWQIYQIDNMWACLVTIAGVGLVITYAVRWAERRFLRWRHY